MFWNGGPKFCNLYEGLTCDWYHKPLAFARLTKEKCSSDLCDSSFTSLVSKLPPDKILLLRKHLLQYPTPQLLQVQERQDMNPDPWQKVLAT